MFPYVYSCKIALIFWKDFKRRKRREKSVTERKLCCCYEDKKLPNNEVLYKILKTRRFCGGLQSIYFGVSY